MAPVAGWDGEDLGRSAQNSKQVVCSLLCFCNSGGH